MNERWCARVVVCGSLLALASCIPEGSTAMTAASAENTADGTKCPADGAIDDGEDQNNQVATKKGRGGYWYTFADKAGSTVTPAAGEQGGTFTMSPGGASGSAQAARVNGKIGSGQVVFAGMGFNFVDPKGPYNATAYKGIAFWAKVSAGSATKVRIKLPGADTDPEGKVCKECYNDFGMDLELTTKWTRYVLPFSAAAQLAGWGSPRPGSLDTTKMYGIQWQVNSPGAEYDVWIDDIEFTGCL